MMFDIREFQQPPFNFDLENFNKLDYEESVKKLFHIFLLCLFNYFRSHVF